MGAQMHLPAPASAPAPPTEQFPQRCPVPDAMLANIESSCLNI